MFDYFHVFRDFFIKNFMKRVNNMQIDWTVCERARIISSNFTLFLDLCMSVFVKEFDLLYVRLYFIN